MHANIVFYAASADELDGHLLSPVGVEPELDFSELAFAEGLQKDVRAEFGYRSVRMSGGVCDGGWVLPDVEDQVGLVSVSLMARVTAGGRRRRRELLLRGRVVLPGGWSWSELETIHSLFFLPWAAHRRSENRGRIRDEYGSKAKNFRELWRLLGGERSDPAESKV